MISFLYVILAILGLGVLVFIHELGHYFMAKRVKMKIEVFSIGFGRPIYSWQRGDVKWQICILPFGGYVKIAGMQKEDGKEPHEIPNGFFAKKPIDRIKVAVMGPFVNLVFAFLIFTVIWSFGGRNKNYAEVTNKIGFVDNKSELYSYNVKAGDEIVEYDNRKYNNFKDLIYASVLDGDKTEIKGYKNSYFKDKKIPFEYTLSSYPDPNYKKEGLSTIGILAPASYIITSDITKESPLKNSLNKNDRILWVNGELVFSNQQLSSFLNEEKVFLTIQRGNQIFHSKIDTYKLADLKLNSYDLDEVNDWKYSLNLKSNVNDLTFIPYFFNESNVIEKDLRVTNDNILSQDNRSAFNIPLKPNDKIIAISGKKVSNAYELLSFLQNKHILMIVQREPNLLNKVSYKQADQDFYKNVNFKDLNSLIKSIGFEETISISNLALLSPIQSRTLNELAVQDNFLQKEIVQLHKKIDIIKNPEEKAKAIKDLDSQLNRYYLGIQLKDQQVKYNPSPLKMFSDVFQEIYRTLLALVSGNLSPKHMAGPIGIVHVVQKSWSLGIFEAFFWLAVISLNLGVFNLLPIPVLDGGHIVFSLIEMITKRPLKAKTMERLIIPFVVLLIGAIIFITYQDLVRIFTKFF